MNTFGFAVFFFTVAVASAEYRWSTAIKMGNDWNPSQLGAIFLHVSGTVWGETVIPVDEYCGDTNKKSELTPCFWSLGPTHTFKSDITSPIAVPSSGVSFEWRRYNNPYGNSQDARDISVKKVTLTDANSRKTVNFCYDGPNVAPGTVHKMKAC